MKEYAPYIVGLVIVILIENFATPVQSFMLFLIGFVAYICWKILEGLWTPNR